MSQSEYENKEIFAVNFSKQDLRFTKVNGFDKVELKGTVPIRKVASPELPVKILPFLVPKDKNLASIEILEDKTLEIDGQYTILPAQQSQSYSEKEETFTLPEKNAYESEDLYPLNIAEIADQGTLSGLKVVSVRVYPLQYIPKSKKLILHTRIKLLLHYESSAEMSGAMVDLSQRSEEGTKQVKDFLRKVVVNDYKVEPVYLDTLEKNKEELKNSVSFDSDGLKDSSNNAIDYLIITNESLVGAFQPLADYRASQGLTTHIETIEYLEQYWTGRDLQEKIRNYAQFLYEYAGTTYLLLGGDTNIIPARYVETDVYDVFGQSPGRQPQPCDMYFSDLDGDWDADGDGIFGELEDDSVDLYPDIFVGRAPVENQQEAEIFVNKTITFEGMALEDYGDRKALFIGTDDFNNSGAMTKELIDKIYMPPEYDPITKLYESEGTESAETVFPNLNLGYYLVNHIDHGDIDKIVTGLDYIGMSGDSQAAADIDSLSNAPYFSFLWSCACYSGAFDVDSIAEHWINNPNGGGVGYIGNSRMGLNPESDQMLDPEYYHSLFVDGISFAGEALADSKVTFIADAKTSGENMRWAMMELNLLGDPALQLKAIPQTGATIQVPSDYPTIQMAVDAASMGDTVSVAPGQYTENINFSGKTVTVKSTDGPLVTIINGEGNDSVVTFDSGESVGSVLEGFTIQGGSAYDENEDGFFHGGGGIEIIFGSSPSIKNNIIKNNNAQVLDGSGGYGGGGIYVAYDSAPIIENNVISDNVANVGGGIMLLHSVFSVVKGNVIKNNRSSDFGGGGILWGDSYLSKFENNIVFNNETAHRGGGVAVFQSFIDSRNNTIVGNRATLEGGGIFFQDYYGQMKDSIIWDNESPTGAEISIEAAQEPPLPVLSYSLVASDFSGETLIHHDPLFVDSQNENFHLRINSLAIDAGDPASDYSLEPEPNGKRINLGAYGNTSQATMTLPIDGGWCGWSKCFKNKQYRSCACPAPANGGEICQGLSARTCTDIISIQEATEYDNLY